MLFLTDLFSSVSARAWDWQLNCYFLIGLDDLRGTHEMFAHATVITKTRFVTFLDKYNFGSY